MRRRTNRAVPTVADRWSGAGNARARCGPRVMWSCRSPAPICVARPVEPGVFPLDERLGLLPGSSLTPSLIDSLVRLGASVPFAQAADLVAHFTGVTVGAE